MAKIAANVSESVYSIKRWLGVNEAQEGEASLRFGEAAVCRNFRVTSGGALQRRPGSRNVAGLQTGFDVIADGAVTSLRTEYASSSASFVMYPRVTTNSVGTPTPEGTPELVSAANAGEFGGFYSTVNGRLCQFRELAVFPRTKRGTVYPTYRGGAYIDDNSTVDAFFLAADAAAWNGTSFQFTNPRVVRSGGLSSCFGKYTLMENANFPVSLFRRRDDPPSVDELAARGLPGLIGVLDDWAPDTSPYWQNGYPWFSISLAVSVYDEARYEWRFSATRSVPNTSGSAVRGIWSGFVGGREVLCAACSGRLWELEQGPAGWSKASCGLVDTESDVHMFGFDGKLYILNGSSYKVWDGATLSDVEGYRPLVTVSATPAGGGTELERVNLLTAKKRCRFSPDGEAAAFRLPERNIESVDGVRSLVTGELLAVSSVDFTGGVVTLSEAPAAGVNTLEISWTGRTSLRNQVTSMRYAELYNGAQDTRVFIYGDGSNRTLYSGLDSEGRPRADYFPDLNEISVGDVNTPVTAMVRHYGRLLCFKLDSAWSISYDAVTLTDGRVTAGFYVTPVNRDVGCCAMGQACLVENQPRTLDGRSVVEWLTASGGGLTDDRRNARRVSQRVERTIRSFDLAAAKTFYDKITHEYYVIGSGGEALVHNVETDAWYTYTGFRAVCMINYRDEVYYGTSDGYLRHFSADYLTDEGEAIDALWESGAMDFGADFRRKYSAQLWIGIRPEEAGYLAVTAETDRKSDFAEYSFVRDDAGAVPVMTRIRLKAKKFTYYKLILRNDRANTAATVVSADLKVRGTGFVR